MTRPAERLIMFGRFVDAERRLQFTFDGRPVPALAGQTIAAALYASGQRIFSRSFKYHRPRGLFCVAGECPNCLMEVDGRPNVRTCVEPVRDGQVVRHQNAWPSLRFDILRIFDKMDAQLPVGFYYKRFYRPRWLWPLLEPIVRRIAGIGRVDVNRVPDLQAEVEYVSAEVCVVGGGPAGLAAAVEAAEAGAQVLLLERMPVLGGHVLFDGVELPEVEPFIEALRSNPRVRILTDTAAFGLYADNLLGAFQGRRLLRIRARQIIVCTGGRERPYVFHNNDLPGVFLARGVQRLARLHGVRAGSKAVVLLDHDDGFRVAEELSGLGIDVAAIVDPRPASVSVHVGRGWQSTSIVAGKGGQVEGMSGTKGPRLLLSSVVLEARGRAQLEGVTVAQRLPNGAIADKSQKDIDCDLLCLASALVPANELLLQGGMRFGHHEGRWRPTQEIAGLFAAGAAAGTFDLAAQILEGRLRGAEAAVALGYPATALAEYRQQWETWLAQPQRPPFSNLMPFVDIEAHKRFVCLCEDVTQVDLEDAVEEGFDEIETLKRYATVTMGPCQGKVCAHAALEICARATNREIAAVGTTTSRPPAMPVPLCVLAASRSHPVRRTPLHHWHEKAGARWLDAGLWKRPESYGDPAAEVRAIRTKVGLIDVGTLGKIELIGPDAAELLERIYLNKWAHLEPGRTRYAAMCTDEGILFDDGIGVRLGPDHFYLTASTGNAEAVVQWLERWQVSWGLKVTILNQTSALAGMNLAGPLAREVLAKVTSLDLSNAAFPYLALREGEVAGVPCKLLRIGFVGELGYELHCPSASAWHLWEALYQAGKDLGLKPCGIEAQRILRLEKGHLIVGVDTDALSNPLEAGLEGLVNFAKPLFHGREPLLRLKAMGPRARLVGFTMENKKLVPDEGCQVVERGRPVGRVTSARFSPTLEQCIGLAWVPVAQAKEGERFWIRANGSDVAARVAKLPFYDPEGKRMKA